MPEQSANDRPKAAPKPLASSLVSWRDLLRLVESAVFLAIFLTVCLIVLAVCYFPRATDDWGQSGQAQFDLAEAEAFYEGSLDGGVRGVRAGGVRGRGEFGGEFGDGARTRPRGDSRRCSFPLRLWTGVVKRQSATKFPLQTGDKLAVAQRHSRIRCIANITPLGDVVRYALRHHTGRPRHSRGCYRTAGSAPEFGLRPRTASSPNCHPELPPQNSTSPGCIVPGAPPKINS